jgi:hypothetical protein
VVFQSPAFIAFTGVDRLDVSDALIALSARYPIEWGILVDDARGGEALFPDMKTRARLLRCGPLRWAAHVCGPQAKAIAGTGQLGPLNLAGFQRVQVNHSFSGSDDTHVANSTTFARRCGMRPVLQCPGIFPADLRVDWLFDTSFGKGTRPGSWPALPASGPFCGFSGGLNPENVREILERIAAPAGTLYWIDMESGVRSDGWLDVTKCEAVCRAVYG